MGKWLAIAAALVLAVLVAAVTLYRPAIPTVREIQAQQLTYDELVDLVTRHPKVKQPAAYAAFLFRRAYGRNPGQPARQDRPA